MCRGETLAFSTAGERGEEGRSDEFVRVSRCGSAVWPDRTEIQGGQVLVGGPRPLRAGADVRPPGGGDLQDAVDSGARGPAAAAFDPRDPHAAPHRPEAP